MDVVDVLRVEDVPDEFFGDIFVVMVFLLF